MDLHFRRVTAVIPDATGIAQNLNAEYRSVVTLIGDTPIPGLAQEGKEEQFDKLRALVDSMVEYLMVSVPGFSATKFYQAVYS